MDLTEFNEIKQTFTVESPLLLLKNTQENKKKLENFKKITSGGVIPEKARYDMRDQPTTASFENGKVQFNSVPELAFDPERLLLACMGGELENNAFVIHYPHTDNQGKITGVSTFMISSDKASQFKRGIATFYNQTFSQDQKVVYSSQPTGFDATNLLLTLNRTSRLLKLLGEDEVSFSSGVNPYPLIDGATYHTEILPLPQHKNAYSGIIQRFQDPQYSSYVGLASVKVPDEKYF